MGFSYALKLAGKTPYYEFLKFDIEEVGDGFCRIRLPYRKEVTHPYGFIHGGAIASLLDSASVMALLSLLEDDKKVATLEIKVNFIRPADEDIVGEAKILRVGSRTAVADGSCFGKGGELIAKSLATIVIY